MRLNRPLKYSEAQSVNFTLSPTPSYLAALNKTTDDTTDVLHIRVDIIDANDNPHHNFKRDELIALLDFHLAERKGG